MNISIKLNVKKAISCLLCLTFLFNNVPFALANDSNVTNNNSVYLKKSDDGIGIYTIHEDASLYKTNDAILAQKDSIYQDIYRAIDTDGQNIIVVAATDTLFQSVDEVIVTENNVEDTISEYDLHDKLANALRNAVNSEEHPIITAFLPKNFSTYGTYPAGTTEYTYNGYQLQKILWGVSPLANGRPLELASGSSAKSEQVKNLTILVQNVVGTFVKEVGIANLIISTIDNAFTFHTSAGDRIDMYLLENKTRTYINVKESGIYMPRAVHDTAAWRFKINEITNDMSATSYTPYYDSRNLMSVNDLNEKAIQYYGHNEFDPMFIDTLPYYIVKGSRTLRFNSELQ